MFEFFQILNSPGPLYQRTKKKRDGCSSLKYKNEQTREFLRKKKDTRPAARRAAGF